MGLKTNSKCFRLTLSYPTNAEMRRITTTPSSCIKGIKNEFWLEEGRRKKLDFFPSQSLAVRFSTEVAGLGDGQGVPTALLQRPGALLKIPGPNLPAMESDFSLQICLPRLPKTELPVVASLVL